VRTREIEAHAIKIDCESEGTVGTKRTPHNDLQTRYAHALRSGCDASLEIAPFAGFALPILLDK
jgi:hypothetical protein